MNKNKGVVLCGIPGSGKTTFSNQCSNIKILHQDDYLYPYENFYAEIKQSTSDVLIDGLYITKELRKKILKALPQDFQRIICVFIVPLETCISRNHDRTRVLPDDLIERAYRNFSFPSYDEGWDEIYYCYEKE